MAAFSSSPTAEQLSSAKPLSLSSPSLSVCVDRHVATAGKWRSYGMPCSHIRFRCSPSLSHIIDRKVVSVICAQSALVEPQRPSVKPQTGMWMWSRSGTNVNVFYEEHTSIDSASPLQNLLLLPTISDVSTTEEWRAVASNLLGRETALWRILIVDWPGFGLSDRPRMEYTADNLEDFLVEFVTSADSPLSASSDPPIIVGAGHAASLAMRAIKKGRMKVRAMAAVAPTWAGPMPIVFGREPDMESRYGLLRNSLQAPAVGWMMYNFMVSSPDNIRKQYLSHVYADPNNVTPSLLESRLALTKREGARFAPAAFLTGLLDPVKTREEFLSLVAELEGKVPMLVLAASKAPKRSKAEMEALNGAKGVSKYVEVEGALLPQEEYPDEVSKELIDFLVDL